jgi:hypothetical protein
MSVAAIAMEGLEALICLARAHGYPFVFIQLVKAGLNPVAPFTGVLVEGCGNLPIGFRRYNRDDATVQQVMSYPIRIESPVGQQLPG